MQTQAVRTNLARVILEVSRFLKSKRSVKASATSEDMISGYDGDLRELVQSLLRGGHRLSKADFRRQMKATIKDYGREGFRVAWEEGGNDVDEIDSSDLEIMQEWISDQQSFVDGFADWLKDKESDLDDVPSRIDVWVDS